MDVFRLVEDTNAQKVRLLLPMTDDSKLLKEHIKQLIPDTKFVRRSTVTTLTSDTVVIADTAFAEYNCNANNVANILFV
jgi:hypothetical protein